MPTPSEATRLRALTVPCLHWFAAKVDAGRAAYDTAWAWARVDALADAQGMVEQALDEAKNAGFTNPRLEDALRTVHHELDKAILQTAEDAR
jgi:hypothetical protein